MRVALKTFGCKANSVDSDVLLGEIRRRGLELVSEDSFADAYIINSCTVTSNADRDARQEALRFKRRNPNSLVAVIGCYAQIAKEELLRETAVDFVLGTADKLRILDCFENRWEKPRDQVTPATGFLTEHFLGSRLARPSIKVQDGCNFSCSFCVIPQARGRSRSLPIATILQQIKEAEAQGFEEVTLTGIHLAHYGWDIATDLMTLIKEVLKGAGPRIRVSTLDPFEIPDELIGLLTQNPRLCPHFHIALQSGSDSVLKDMRRFYKSSEFVEVTKKIEKARPNTFIGVDVIVGFPGETEEKFHETVDCLEKSYWSKLHVFSFSERRDTAAVLLANKVSPKDIQARSKHLREMSDVRLKSFLQKQVGQTREVILEKPKGNFWVGHTENYLPALVPVSSGNTKQKVPVRITGLLTEATPLLTSAVL